MIAELRPVCIADAGRLATVHAGCFAEAWSAEAFTLLLGSAAVFGIAARLNESDLQGFVLARVAADEAEILTLCTLPAVRGKGIGSRVVGAALEYAEKRGALHMYLEVAENNAAALRLYTKCGFTVVGRRRGYYSLPGSRPVDALMLSLTLPGSRPT